ncbi:MULTISPECIES: DUF4129 domain-containing protein [Bacillaceae]|uniref:DUF4129 domain-containing protein n=1 Tax=Evansella alkalicola TaxID=745819 RepID=A0ABS6JNH7_9BACI|nr:MULTISPECIES: DUF4129 domain-containing protein [Bacillaceae]MBU9720111.1 DUF4129 domain-containing protein [Bacillus alkalicola]
MKKWHLEVSRWLSFSLDMTLLYLLIAPLYITEGRFPPLFSFLLLTICGFGITMIIVRRINKKWVLLSFLFIIGVALLLSFHLVLAIFLAMVLTWRGLAYMEHHEQTNQVAVFFVTFLFGILYYILFHSFEGIVGVLVIIYIQFLLLLFSKMVSASMQSGLTAKQISYQIKWTLGGLCSIAGVAIIAGLGQPAIREAVTFLWSSFLSIISYLAAPLLSVLGRVFLPDAEIETDIFDSEESGGETGNMQMGLDEYVEASYAGPMFLAIFFLIILFLIIRSILNFRRLQPERIAVEGLEERSLATADNFFNKKFFAPDDVVRRRLFQLERRLSRMGLGRKRNETVDDWFARLPGDAEIKGQVIDTYEKVRYGEEDVARKERAAFKAAIKVLIKQIDKARKESETDN